MSEMSEVSEKKDLSALRERIDAVDSKLLALLSERADLVAEIAEAKRASGLGTVDPERENALLRKVIDRGAGRFPKEAIVAVFREIMSASVSLQSTVTVSYLGPAGTFSHTAARTLFGYAPRYVEAATIEGVFDAVRADRAQFGNLGFVSRPVEDAGDDVGGEAPYHGAPSAQVPQHHPDQPRLHRGRRNAVDRQRKSDHLRAPPETRLAEIGPDRGVDEERDAVDEAEREERPQARQRREVPERAHRVGPAPVERPTRPLGHRLRHHEPAKDRVGGGQHGGGVERRPRPPFRQQPADQRAEDEAHAERRADQAEVRGLVLGLGDVGHEGHRGRLRRRRDPADEPPRQEQPDRPRDRHHEVVERHHGQRDEEDGAAPVTVREAADRGAEQELHDCEAGRQHPAPERGAAEAEARDLLDQVGHDGQDQADPHRIDDDGDEDEQDRGVAAHGRALDRMSRS